MLSNDAKMKTTLGFKEHITMDDWKKKMMVCGERREDVRKWKLSLEGKKKKMENEEEIGIGIVENNY